MKIATWNVNSIGVRLERLLKFLDREAPDVVCLQELKCDDGKFPREALANAGWQATVFGQKAYNGVALLTKQRPDQEFRGFADAVEDPAARCVGVRMGRTTFMSVYVPNGQEIGCDKYVYKLKWMARLKEFVAKELRTTDSIIVAGDYNIAPDDRDVYDPVAWKEHIHCSARERNTLHDFASLGFTDSYRRLHQDSTEFSWWDYRALSFPLNRGLRIDLIYATEALNSRVKRCWVDRDERKGDRPSDHAPVLAEFADL